jgi:CheY-like chemotaxis protein
VCYWEFLVSKYGAISAFVYGDAQKCRKRTGENSPHKRLPNKINPNCVAIFITAYPALETAHRAIQLDINGYVNKPADIDELVALMERKLLDRRARTNAVSG